MTSRMRLNMNPIQMTNKKGIRKSAKYLDSETSSSGVHLMTKIPMVMFSTAMRMYTKMCLLMFNLPFSSITYGT